MSRRELIEMSHEELVGFIAEQRIVTCATLGPHGRPHLMPLWFVADGTTIDCWTYAKSQKAKNLERDPHATLQLEAGVAYEELRGAMLECDVELTHDPDRVAEVGLAVMLRNASGQLPPGETPQPLRDLVASQASKRVALRFTPTRIATWDHRKLGGVY
jgi:hypothetical protein